MLSKARLAKDRQPGEVPLRDSIATLLLRQVFLLYVTVALLLTAGYLAFLHYEARTAIDRQLRVYERVFRAGLELHLWNLERDEMNAFTAGMVDLSNVVGVTVTLTETGELFSSAGIYEDRRGRRIAAARRGDAKVLLQQGQRLAPLIAHRFALTHKSPDGEVALGTATVYSDTDLVWQMVRMDYLLVFGSAVIKAAALWLIFVHVARRLLRRPLREPTQATARVRIDTLEPVSVDLSGHGNDELMVLTESFNFMLGKLLAARLDMEAAQARLEQAVAARTEELSAAKAAAESANQAKSRFIAHVSHDLRTPLNAILGFSEILARRATDPEQREFLRAIRDSGLNLSTLVEDVLDLARAEAGQLRLNPRPFALRPLLESAANTVRAEAKGLGLILDHSPDLPAMLHLDEDRLRQILLNLLTNAVKFTHSGQVKLRARRIAPLSPAGRGAGGDGLADLDIEVEDSGSGIPAADRERIFLPFEQRAHVQQARAGVGLGLAIVRQLAQSMGADISVGDARRRRQRLHPRPARRGNPGAARSGGGKRRAGFVFPSGPHTHRRRRARQPHTAGNVAGRGRL
jgi:signal transduction histidine kinase